MKAIIPGILIMTVFALTSSPRAQMSIAVVGPMTGQYASFGEQMRRGAEMAVADINAQGGVLGQRLELEVGNDACDPERAVAVAEQMAKSRVIFVAGHFCSGSSIPASNTYRKEDILQISPASTNPKLTERGLDNVFRVCGRDDQQGIVAGSYIAHHFGDQAIAILHDKTPYGKGLADQTRAQLQARGIREVLYTAYSVRNQDYSDLVKKMKAAGIGLVYIGGYHTEAALIARLIRQHELDAVLMSGDALVTDEYWAITGKAGEGTLMTFTPDPAKNPAAQSVVARFRARGFEPGGYTLYTYGAVQAFAQAAARARSTKLSKLIRTLKRAEFDTVLGQMGFDDQGDVTAPGYAVYVWEDGQYDYVQN